MRQREALSFERLADVLGCLPSTLLPIQGGFGLCPTEGLLGMCPRSLGDAGPGRCDSHLEEVRVMVRLHWPEAGRETGGTWTPMQRRSWRQRVRFCRAPSDPVEEN